MSVCDITAKRSSDEFEEESAPKIQKTEEVSEEDLEEALWQIKKCAAKDRATLVSKAKAYYQSRNGEAPSSEEVDSVFNTLRDKIIDYDAAQTSSDDESDYSSDEFEKLQNDIEGVFEHVTDLGKHARSQIEDYFKTLWIKENNGGEPSPEETEAVFYNVKHLIKNVTVVEDESEGEDEDYEPSELEKEAHEADEQEEYEYEGIAFDFPAQVQVSEEQFEALCEKFITEKGRKPTSEEADAILQSFKSKLLTASLEDSDDDDYSPDSDAEDESEDESLAEDTSLEEAEQMDVEESEDESEDISVDPKSEAFGYMQELEEGTSSSSEEEEQEDEQDEAETTEVTTTVELSKVQQSQEIQTAHQVCA